MDYRTYALMAILLASVVFIAQEIGNTATPAHATVNETVPATVNETVPATVNETVPATVNETGEWTTFNLTIDDQTYPIEYMITGGSVENMTIHTENLTLGVSINSTDIGTLNVRLPRDVIDAQTEEGVDTNFVAWIDAVEFSEPGETETTELMREVSIGFPSGARTVDIQGTFIIPEFSTIASVVLAVAIVGIIIATASHSKFNFGPRL